MGGEESSPATTSSTTANTSSVLSENNLPSAKTTQPTTYGNHVMVEKKIKKAPPQSMDTSNNIKIKEAKNIQTSPLATNNQQITINKNDDNNNEIKEEVLVTNNDENKLQSHHIENETQKQPILTPLQQQINNYFNLGFPIALDKEVFDIRQEIIDLRHYFHHNPELSFYEKNTSANIIKYCKALGLRIKEKVGGIDTKHENKENKENKENNTGLVAVLHGSDNNGPCIALRCDMDALPIQEMNENISYKSRVDGISHACGHDCHMAILLSVARILSLQKYISQIHGCIKFIFQPAEEGGAGAKYMIKDGVLLEDNEILNCPEVSEIYGLHVWSYQPLGKLVVKSGNLMAGSCSFEISIVGIGGHGAEPKGTSDTVLATSQLIIALNSIISRNLSPLETGVLSVCQINVGQKSNIIAENGKIVGTMRWMNHEIYLRITQRIREICNGIEITFNVKINIKYSDEPYPSVENHVKQTNNVKNAVSKLLAINENNNNNNQEIDINNNKLLVTEAHEQKTMAAEDFSFYLQKKPGCFFFLGCAEKEKFDKNEIFAHHTPYFRVDERCLVLGVQIFVNLIMSLMTKPTNNQNNNNNNNNNNNSNQVLSNESQLNDTQQPQQGNNVNIENKDDEKLEQLPNTKNDNDNNNNTEAEKEIKPEHEKEKEKKNENENEDERQDTPDIIADHEKPAKMIQK